ncbi:DUF3226 domain-containing protein [Methylobacter psychrophilus]|uniref:DUF3226 domain-containing protein n=1 Tax=Methylobacter psychrophilus TaxID=96941 RepID=UPI0021D4B6F7|nr:DUF3226 domain-containing protein [Methylobacter psychrophilus]
MAASKKILLVEGEADKGFFEQICKSLVLDTEVRVASPKDLEGVRNSKQGVFNLLPTLLPLLLIEDGLTHIAIIVDADYLVLNGLGYQKTIERVSDIVRPFGFEFDQNAASGILYKHSDGLADFGLWIMPNNQDEGMLEDWIKSCVNVSEQALFQQATQAVQQVSTRKFPEHLLSKAEVATWLAWQKQPGHGLYAAITDQLLDNQLPLFKELELWLCRIFAQETGQ